MDGEITIGTKLVTDKFDRQIAELEKKMKKEEDKKIVIDVKLGSQQEELDKARQKTDALADAYQRLKEVQDRLATGQATPKEFTTFQDLQNTYGTLEQLGASFDKALTKQNAIEQKVAQTKYRYDEINAKVSEYKQKIENVKIQKQVAEVEKLKNSFNNVGSSIQKSITNVARLALGIFGIRSAYLALRRASSDLASYDQQYATNLEYIRYALTQAIAPVLRYIVSLAATLLQYIYAILNAWFGIGSKIDISAKSFNKMKTGASGVSKAVKEIKKQLAGFDEINMLTDQSDTGTGAGAGGVGMPMPDFDLSALKSEPPKWLQWIIDHKNEILSALAGIAAGLTALKFGIKGIKALGVGLLISGVVYAIKGLLDYLKSPTWKNFGKIIQGIGTAIIGLGAIIGSVPVAVTGAVVLIVGTIVKYWEQIKSFLQNGLDWLKGRTDWVRQYFGIVGEAIYMSIIYVLQQILNTFDVVFKSIKAILDQIITFIKTGFTQGWNVAFANLGATAKSVFASITNSILNAFTSLVSGISTKIEKIKGFFRGMIGKITGWFNGLAVSIPNTIAAKFKSIINQVLNAIESVLNKPIGAINSLIGEVNKLPGVNIGKLGKIKLGRLAVGGIVNMPNKGRLIGGQAIAGESGAEGVIPLTDSQAMETLGSAIGRYITINAVIENRMNGRIISRELKQVENNQDFAYNI